MFQSEKLECVEAAAMTVTVEIAARTETVAAAELAAAAELLAAAVVPRLGFAELEEGLVVWRSISISIFQTKYDFLST